MSRSVKPGVFAGDNLIVDTVVVSRLRLYAVSDDCFYECDRVFRCRTQRYDFKNVRVPAEKIRVLFVTATKDGCTDGTINLTVRDQSGGDSGGVTGTLDCTSGTVDKNIEITGSVDSITLDITQDSSATNTLYVTLGNASEIAGANIIVKSNPVEIKDSWKSWNNNVTFTVVDGKIVIKNIPTDVTFMRLMNNKEGAKVKVTYTINYAFTSPQTLLAPRRAVAAAAVIESEQLLSAANETAGVQAQALENTIDASQVSDADWANGLLLEIDATDGWQGSVSNLPVTDSNGNTYYYWAVEEPVTGYTPSYLYQDGDETQGTAIRADKLTDGTDIIVLNTKQDTSYTLPSTGGTGVTRYYLIGLLLVGGSGLVVCYQFRRKRHGNCAK